MAHRTIKSKSISSSRQSPRIRFCITIIQWFNFLSAFSFRQSNRICFLKESRRQLTQPLRFNHKILAHIFLRSQHERMENEPIRLMIEECRCRMNIARLLFHQRFIAFLRIFFSGMHKIARCDRFLNIYFLMLGTATTTTITAQSISIADRK